jgi:hypothetical protein
MIARPQDWKDWQDHTLPPAACNKIITSEKIEKI